MSFGLGSAVDLGIVIEARDLASSVFESIGKTMESIIGTTADFQTTLNQVQNNTVLTSAQMAQMQQSVLSMARESGAGLSDLSNAFMHATNLGFGMADATKVVQAGMESAVSTGANVSDVVTTLALQMHEFGLGADDAGRAMNVLHLAAALGNATLEQFSTETTKATSMAANLGIPITQVDAALAALSRHMDLSQANTALAGEFSKLVNPAAATVKELQHLSDVTGVKGLVQDFTAAGMQAKGFPAVMDDLKRATGGNVTEMLKLIPAMRGGLAEMVLLGTGSQDYTDILKQLNEAMGGQLDPTTQAYQRTLDTFNQRIAIVQQDLQQLFIAIGTPVLDTLTPYLNQISTWVNTHQKEVTDFGHALGTSIAGGVKAIATEVATHKAEIEAFIKSLSTDLVEGVKTLVADLPSLVSDFGQMAKSIKDFGDQLAPVVKGMGDFVGFLQSMNSLGYDLGAGLRSKFSSSPMMDPTRTATDTPTNVTYRYGPAIPASYGRVEPGRFGAENFLLYDLPKLPASDLGGTAPNRTRPGGTGLGADAPGYQDAQQATAAAQRAYKDALNAFWIDMDSSNWAGATRDISTILKDMVPLLGFDASDREVERRSLLKEIASATKGTHAAVTTNWRVFAPNLSASEGQTIAAYGLSAGQNSQAQVIATLREQVRHLQDVVRLLTGQQAAAERLQVAGERTARNTDDMKNSLGSIAHEAATPHQAQSPFTHGLGTARAF